MAGCRRVFSLYRKLLGAYGRQGWWPVIRRGEMRYHPGDYSVPANEDERFQIAIGAILAQNTSWKNAEKALLSLYCAGALCPDALAKMPEGDVAKLIRSSGYYNQKAGRIKDFLPVYSLLPECRSAEEMREILLGVKGIGPETADSILLYAFKKPFFVVDAYTRRFCSRNRLCGTCGNWGYEKYRGFFEKNLPRDRRIYNEYHALIVAWGKSSAKRQRR